MVLDVNQRRKLDHLDIAINKPVEGPLTNFFEYVFLVHNALPDISIDDVDLSTKFLGKELKAPIMITGITGGAPGTEKINEALASVAEEFGIAIGVGSQRVALSNPELASTYRVVRNICSSVPVVANIGISEVVKLPMSKIEEIIEMIKADALAIHLNLAQEFVQPEGSNYVGRALDKIAELGSRLSVPLIIKEVGFGLSYEVVRDLRNIGVKMFDVAGAGGTNWVKVEMYRAKEQGDLVKELMAANMLEWGIPTAASIIEARNAAPDALIIGSGGIRSALDAVKALRLGADIVGIARPALLHLKMGTLSAFINSFIRSIKALMALTNSRSVNELRSKPVIVMGPLKDWIISRGLKLSV